MTARIVGIVLLAISAAGAAVASTRAAQVTLAVPPAQSVALVAVKLSGTATPRLASGAPARSTALVVTKGGTLFAVVLNRSGRGGSMKLAGPGSTSARTLRDVGRTSPAALRSFARGLAPFLGWDPLGKPDALTGSDVTLRVFDPRHPGGRTIEPTLAERAAEAVTQLLIAPNISVRDEVYKQIDETSACILGRIECSSYVFRFGGLQETVYRADQPNFRLTTTYSGRTCGRTPLGQPWRITYKSGGKGPVTRTMNFARSNIVFTTRGKIKGTTGTAIHKLAPISGAFPQMEALVDSTGGWSSNSGDRFAVVTVTKLSAGKHC